MVERQNRLTTFPFSFTNARIQISIRCYSLHFGSSNSSLHKQPEGSEYSLENFSGDVLPLSRLIVFSAFFALVMFTITLFRPFVPSFLSDIYNYREFEIGIFGSISFFGSAVLGIILGKVGDK